MKESQIINYLKIIRGELTDAYNVTTDIPQNSDTLYYIDNSIDLINELEDNINGKFDNRPLTHEEIHHVPGGDGEGRLKGNN